MSAPLPEPWLRGPVGNIAPSLLPVAHALVAAREETEAAVRGLEASQVWIEPAGAASVGFHLLHLAGSTDRLLTYARGEPLSEAQREALAAERTPPDPRPGLESLLGEWGKTVERALAQLERTPESVLNDPRGVGRAQLPSSVRGLLFHAADHARRHGGQILTTAAILRGLFPREERAGGGGR